MLPREAYFTMFLGSMPLAVINFLLAIYIKYLGGNELLVGMAYASYSFFTVVSRPVSGYIIDKGGFKGVLYSGMWSLILGFSWLSIAPDPLNVILAMALVGLGFGFVNVALLVYITGLGGATNPGLYGELTSASALGGAFAAGIGFLFLIISEILKEYLFCMKLIFLTYTLLCLVPGTYFILKIKETRPVEEQNCINFSPLAYILTATALQAMGSGISYPMIMPFLINRFHATPYTIMLAYIPSGAAWILVSRKVGDFIKRYGINLFCGFSTLLSAMTVSLIPHVNNLMALSVLWALEAVGLSIWYVVLQAIIPKLSSSYVWGRAYGLQNMSYFASYTLGALVGGALYSFVGVEAVFYSAAFFFALAPLPLLLMILKGFKL